MCTFGLARVLQRLPLLVIGVGLWAAGAQELLRGQTQPAGQPQKQQPQVARCFVKKTQFHLPLNMSQQTRNELSEIQVFCLNNASGKWVHLAKCPPNHTGFDFEAPGEGEFWFTLCMVDKLKRKVPDDPSQSEYKMAVIVDTTPPTVDAQFVSIARDGYVVEVAVQDAHLDPLKTVVEYQTRDQTWRALEAMTPGSTRYLIPVQAAVTGMVKVWAGDLAENVACREFDLPQIRVAAKQLQAPAPVVVEEPSKYIPIIPADPPAPTQTSQGLTTVMPPLLQGTNTVVPPLLAQTPPGMNTVTPPAYVKPGAVLPRSAAGVFSAMPSGPAQTPRAEGGAANIPLIAVEDVSDKVQSPSAAAVRPKEPAPMAQMAPAPRLNETTPTESTPVGDRDGILQRLNATASTDATTDVRPALATTSSSNKPAPVVPVSTTNPPANGTEGNAPAATIMPPTVTPPTNPPTASTPARPASAQRKLINQRQLMLNYRLEHVGASGVGKVEIWITSDQRQSWQKLGEDVERKSPVIVELPGEGLYGITIVVSNGRGFGGTPPNPGDDPDTWVEVDMTRPNVEIKDIRPGGVDDPGTVHVIWNAHDRNLAPDAVDLYYAASREGPWLPIAKGLRNDGHYRWVPPISVGSQVHVRLVARDLAGNATVVETAQSFAVDDMSRPRGRLIGIVPVSGEIRPESDH